MHFPFCKKTTSPEARRQTLPGKRGRGSGPPAAGALPPLPPDRHVFLTGFMGAGKSTAGPILAGLLGRAFTDLDRDIEMTEGMAIPEIFADPARGEAYFRGREAERIRMLVTSRTLPRVIALGGGAVEDPATRALLRDSANTFFLDAGDADALWERAGRDGPGRPLARHRADFGRLLKRRLPLYLSCGMQVDARGLDPRGVARAVTRILFRGREALLSPPGGRDSRLSAWPDRESLAEGLRERLAGGRALLLLDPALRSEAGFWREFLAGRGDVLVPESRGEEVKTFASAERILGELAARSFDRSDWLLARGGGSLTDVGGFCAGLFKRGMRLALMPTTLLAAADAAVGGKTAVNFAGAKNQCGIFYLPEEVLIEGEVLRRLPAPLVEEGLTEVYKTGLIRDPSLAGLVAREIESFLPPQDAPGPDMLLLLDAAWRAASLKAGIVSEDFREERGVRDVLNFGHTFGHAVESHYAGAEVPVSHGRAVAFGMAAALVLSERSWGLDADLARAARAVCLRLSQGGYPPVPPAESLERLFLADKKSRYGRLKFVALKAPGAPVVTGLEPAELAAAAREAVREVEAREILPWSRL